MRTLFFAAIVALVALPARAQEIESAWVQYAPGGAAEARATVAGQTCRALAVDGVDTAMTVRAVGDAAFPTVCSAPIPAGAKAVTIGEHVLPVPAANPTRILVMGDTGCRIKGRNVQSCNDPRRWPFPDMAKEEAKLKPDLVIDVGDYLYRENACPPGVSGCAGTPHGDNWPTWNADFFAPAAPLLAAAPWVVVRGNHEDCVRAGSGWLRLMGPLAFDPSAGCVTHLAPYSVPIGAVTLVVLDDADAPDTSVAADMVPVYRSEIAALADAPAPSWLLMHRPIWGAIAGPFGIPVGGNRTLIAAIGSAGIPKPVELMLSGHIHSFEAINYAAKNRVPPQIVAGFGGDKLDRTPRVLPGTVFQGSSDVSVRHGLSLPGFGFLMMRKSASGWDIDVHDVRGKIERRCWFRVEHVGCASPR